MIGLQTRIRLRWRAGLLAAALTLVFTSIASAQNACPLTPDLSRSGADEAVIARDLGAMHGFAKLAGTTGGNGRGTFVVSNGSDNPTSPAAGSLRAAIEAARQAGGGIIVFENASASNLNITLQDQIRVPSNTTIDGGCARVSVSGREDISLFRLDGVENVIIRRLRMRKTTECQAGRDEDGVCLLEQDAVFVKAPVDKVWIAQNTFSQCGDGCVDIAAVDPVTQVMRATVAFNRFQSHNKVMLIGDISCLTIAKAVPDCLLSASAELTIFVTIERNAFVNTTQRHPKAVSRTYIHSSGNVLFTAPYTYANGRVGSNYGMLAASGARILSEYDIIRPLQIQRESMGIYALTEPRQAISATTYSEGPAATRIVGGNFLRSVTNVQNAPALVADPPYSDVVKPKFGSNNVFAAGRHAQCVLARVGHEPQVDPSVACR
ncbi:MAG: hypothetical protein MRY63_02435 [Neomegalonema sp.]|nr:hypothetical protein [Neomegalonema sp.]